ncbi:MAG: hypothetical protein ACF8TS_06440, partial [Maioricimonas sp. JB049]
MAATGGIPRCGAVTDAVRTPIAVDVGTGTRQVVRITSTSSGATQIIVADQSPTPVASGGMTGPIGRNGDHAVVAWKTGVTAWKNGGRR